MTIYSGKKCVQHADQNAIVNLFDATRDELYLPDRNTVEQLINKCFSKGSVIGAYVKDELGGAMGYFYGEPDLNYVNKEVVFMYMAAILPKYRCSRLFHQVFISTLQQFQKEGKTEIRLQAEADNPYTNKLYSRFAEPIAEKKSLRGKRVIEYGASINDALQVLTRRRKRTRSC